jgi:alanine racemase
LTNFRPTVAEINLDSIRHNASALRKAAGPGTFFCPMIKANAYGHGAVEVARVLESMGVSAVGVAIAEEGLELRAAAIKLPILVFGLFGEESAQACVANNLTPVISRAGDLGHFARAAKSDFNIHLKFNTGMSRLGFETSDAQKIAKEVDQSRRLKVAGICSHLVQGEDWADEAGLSRRQAETLTAVAGAFGPATLHLHNSEALLAGKDLMGFGVRPGIALYGAGFGPLVKNTLGLKPVMSFRSKIGLIHEIEAGQGVSYHSTWRAKEKSVIGVIPVGYADGFHRRLSSKARLLVRGQKVPLVGTVCMDYIMCDLTGLVKTQPVEAGEPVTMWGIQAGASMLADEVANQAETIPYELFTSVSRRVPRLFTDGAKTWSDNG